MSAISKRAMQRTRELLPCIYVNDELPGCYTMTSGDCGMASSCCGRCDCQCHHVEAVAALVQELMDEHDAFVAMIERGGEPPELKLWSHHDAPELARALVAERDELRCENALLLDMIACESHAVGISETMSPAERVVAMRREIERLRTALDAARRGETP